MRVSVALEQRFARLPDGSVWTPSSFSEGFWQRYLDVFDRVQCVARVQDVARLDGEWRRADGRAVTFAAVPYYVGPTQYVRRVLEIRRAVRGAVRDGDAYILRVPGAIGSLVSNVLCARGYPFGVEVIGDPYDVFAPGAVRHPLRSFLRWRETRNLRHLCRSACGASYVTAHALQARYPAGGPSIGASSIELRDDAFAARPRRFGAARHSYHLVFIGSLEQYYKAPDVLIEAFSRCLAAGLDLQLTIVGDGRLRPALQALAFSTGCASRVRFTGHLASPEAVRAQLDAADLFVLPSRTEGLPRSMVEAMARGLPCIGSTAGGIPELLAPQAMVPAGDVAALFGKIREVVLDPARMSRMAAANLRKAGEYRHEILQQRRVRFYRQVRESTQAWLRARPPAGRLVASFDGRVAP